MLPRGIVSRIREGEDGAGDGVGMQERLKDEIRRILTETDSGANAGGTWRVPERGLEADARTETPWVVLVVGVNGTGKTTTVGKLAHRFRTEGASPLICAADTFRAAAVEQVATWAGRASVDIVRAGAKADPASVVFDAIKAGGARAARRRDRGHGRPAAHAGGPDGRARQDPTGRRTRAPRCAARSVAGAGRYGWPETESRKPASSWSRPALPVSC